MLLDRNAALAGPAGQSEGGDNSGRSVVRGCDGCTACCGPALLINDPELVSPAGQSCSYLQSGGCSRYGEGMPSTCKRYVCNYLADPRPLKIDDRPDHVGVIIRRAQYRDRAAPMDRVTYINECMDGGLRRSLDSPTWRQAIVEDLLSEVPLLISLNSDAVGQDIINVRYHEGTLCCRLAACDERGNPIMTDVQPVYGSPIRIAWVPGELGFPFDTKALFHRLGNRELTVVESFDQRISEAGIRFRFSRRQAEAIELLHSLLPAGIGRQCGECRACCVAPTINDPQLQLGTGIPCPNLCSAGCSVHGDTMPEVCKAYYCGYMLEPCSLLVSARPDQAGAIVRLVADRSQPPPMDKTVWINECVEGGVSRLVANPVWAIVVRRALRTGVPLLVSRFDDPVAREAIMIRMVNGRLFCGLTSCHGDGSSILKTLQPVYEKNAAGCPDHSGAGVSV